MVVLCDRYNLIEKFGKHFRTNNSEIDLLLPQQIREPESIRHALAFSPGPDAFAPYSNLRMVSCVGAGVDALLNNPSLKSDVCVSRVVIGEQAQMIAGFAIWYVRGWQSRMWEYSKLKENRTWHPIDRTPPSAFPVGILGCGHIGGTLANALQVLGYPVTAYGSRSRDTGNIRVLSGTHGLIEVAKNSRAIVNLLPLTPHTQGILGKDFFANTSDAAILINLGRGEHLIDDDLLNALDQGRLGMAALDVFTHEPLETEHSFWTHPKVMLTPHVAGDADRRSVAQFIAEGVRLFDIGQVPPGLVDRSRGY